MASKHTFKTARRNSGKYLQKALDYRNSKITTVDTYEEFKEKIEEGGFILAHWDGTTETEEKIKEDTKATIRCIPFDSYVEGDKEPGKMYGNGQTFCLPRRFCTFLLKTHIYFN